jgi:membrane-associated phospholipid phosphatase
MTLHGLSPWVLGAASLSLVPSVAQADPATDDRQHFAIDPVADGAVIAVGAGFSGILGLVLSTGEIQPLKAGDANRLFAIDRIAVTQTVDPNAATISDIGLYGAVGFAALDSLLTGFHDRWESALTDTVMYTESLSLALAFTDIVKIAVRRPRPIDYSAENVGNTTNTDLALSFFSGHTSAVAALSGTATYLAFAHSPDSPRPWITLGAGTLLTAFVGYERVRAGQHFPTDVVMGVLGGGSDRRARSALASQEGASAPRLDRPCARSWRHRRESQRPGVLLRPARSQRNLRAIPAISGNLCKIGRNQPVLVLSLGAPRTRRGAVSVA